MMQKILWIFLILLTACHAVTLNRQVVPVFQKYKELNARFLESIQSNGNEQRKKVETFMYDEYTEALNLLENKFCSEPDEGVLDEFVSVLASTSNSAYETPFFVLGKIYICQPDLIIKKIHALTPKDKAYMIRTLDRGLQYAMYQHEDQINNYTELLNRLKSLKAEIE